MPGQIDLKIFNPYKVDGLKRIGNSNDGGYIVHVPSLEYVDCLVNYGVGYNIEFEKQFHQLTGVPVYAFDPTMKKLKYFMEGIRDGEYINTLKRLVKLMLWLPGERSLKKHQIHFIEEGLSANNSGSFKTYEYHLAKYQLLDKKIFLKIDIEEAEFAVLKEESFYRRLDNVIQFVIEFHRLAIHLDELTGILKKIANTHTLIHIHGNNIGSVFSYNGKTIPEVIEVAFLHNALVPEKILSAANYPVQGLDLPCNRRLKDIPLDFFK